MRWALVALILLVAGLAYVWLVNPAALLTPLTLTLAGRTVSIMVRDAVLALAAGWVLVLLGGRLDLDAAHGQLRRYQTALDESERELARVKAEVYDRERGGAAEVQARLAAIDEELARLRARVEDALRVTELHAEVRR